MPLRLLHSSLRLEYFSIPFKPCKQKVFRKYVFRSRRNTFARRPFAARTFARRHLPTVTFARRHLPAETFANRDICQPMTFANQDICQPMTFAAQPA